MPFNPQVSDGKPLDNQHYHRNDFVSALVLDSIGALATNPGGDIGVSGNTNQFNTDAQQVRPSINRPQIWGFPQYFKGNVFVQGESQVFGNSLFPASGLLTPRITWFDNAGSTAPIRWIAEAVNDSNFDILQFSDEQPIGTTIGFPLVLYQG